MALPRAAGGGMLRLKCRMQHKLTAVVGAIRSAACTASGSGQQCGNPHRRIAGGRALAGGAHWCRTHAQLRSGQKRWRSLLQLGVRRPREGLLEVGTARSANSWPHLFACGTNCATR